MHLRNKNEGVPWAPKFLIGRKARALKYERKGHRGTEGQGGC